MNKFMVALLSICLAACASYSGRGLVVGHSDISAVIGLMGMPRMKWADSDGAIQLAYPKGPMGIHTFMVNLRSDGKLQSIKNVLTTEMFSRIRAGMTTDQVLRTLGPSEPSWTVYFEARDELVWEWQYCDDWNKQARFDVLFDGASQTVRSSMSQMVECRRWEMCLCSR
jgi:hypothetical protein